MQGGPYEKLENAHRASIVEKKQGNNCWFPNVWKYKIQLLKYTFLRDTASLLGVGGEWKRLFEQILS